MNVKYFCAVCGKKIPSPPKEWLGHLVQSCPNDESEPGEERHGAVDYGLVGSPWIRHWNVRVVENGVKAE